jgi:deoxyribodipyrimidine photolyase-related protein
MAKPKPPIRKLLAVLGDQLNADAAVWREADPRVDVAWMAEVAEESTHVPSHQARTALFLSAMRHFRDERRAAGWTVDYRELDEPANAGSLAAELRQAIARWRPQCVEVVRPGEWRVQIALEQACRDEGRALRILEDDHFYASLDDFRRHAAGRKQLRQEFFYRELRQRHGVLMAGGKPIGGAWNFDRENRGSFGKQGPPAHPAPRGFAPDATTRGAIRAVAARFANHPGDLSLFDWPVTRHDALAALDDFIACRLPRFGEYQDAMWTGEPYLFHARLSAALNLKLLNPREAVDAAVEAYHGQRAPLPAVEGFVRQILGWREYVRGIYGVEMPAYAQRNALGADQPLPAFYWTGETDMRCLSDALGQTLRIGYAHHIQRLMVTGLFALLLGVEPLQVHAWYLSVYVDAVEWVELPNTLGMSQYADGGLMASKPYAATGSYIQRMSNYCGQCRFRPTAREGSDACPFTVLYWDFLARNRRLLEANPRMKLQVRNLDRLDAQELAAVRRLADRWRRALAAGKSAP